MELCRELGQVVVDSCLLEGVFAGQLFVQFVACVLREVERSEKCCDCLVRLALNRFKTQLPQNIVKCRLDVQEK